MGAFVVGVVVAVVVVVAYVIYKAVTSESEGGGSDGGQDPLDGACQDADQQDKTPVSGHKSQPCAQKPVKPVTHAKLQVIEITFAANHVIDKDTLGPFGTPEWIRGRSADQQSPVCYVRNSPMQMTAKFSVTQAPSASESVEIKAEATIGANRIRFAATVTVAPADKQVVASGISSADKLPDQVACYDAVDIAWEFNPAGAGWESAGNSQHLLYLLLGAPTGTPVYWTLVDISCRAAHGISNEGDVVNRSYAQFMTRSLKRARDKHALTYWNPTSTTATNTRLLLASADGSGQCGSWSEFLIDMWKVHGITSADKVLVIRDQASWSSSSIGFLVKNWTFGPTGSRPAPFTHEMYTECRKSPGVAGQENPNPPPAFFNHFIVRRGSRFYDPSYGSASVSSQTDWEAGAIDGLFKEGTPSTCGYPKASTPGLLLELWDLTTSTKI